MKRHLLSRRFLLAFGVAAMFLGAAPVFGQIGPIKLKPNPGGIILPPHGPGGVILPPPPPKVERPGKHALVVMLENGGISASLKAVLKQDIPFAVLIDPVTDFLAEEMAKFVISIDGARSKYDKVVILEDGNFTAAKVLAKIKELAPSYVLDIHVLSHGSNNRIIGFNGAVLKGSNFFTPLKDYKNTEKKLFIRSVYQINCESGTVVQEWRDAGAEVVSGTSGKKSNFLPNQYVNFLGYWLAGKTFTQAVNQGYNDAKFLATPIYALLGHPEYISDSKLFVTGNGNLKLTSP